MSPKPPETTVEPFAAALRALLPRLQGRHADPAAVLDAIVDIQLPDLPPRRRPDVETALAEARTALQAYGPGSLMAEPLLIRARGALERAAQHASC